MGWSQGSIILQDIVDALKPLNLTVPQAKELYGKLIDIFEDFDCDSLEEVDDPLFQQTLRELRPDWEWED